MRYYSEDDVISIMRDVEDSVTAYEWGCGNRNVKLADYPSVEIPDSPWHTGTPTEDGMYICKVFYGGDEQNDIRILEWVGAMDCFCLPNSDTRGYHFYIGENNGDSPEVVYEWLKLDLRFKMETKWIDPVPIYLNSSIRGTVEDCLKVAKKYRWK